jgi:hypothetical protein
VTHVITWGYGIWNEGGFLFSLFFKSPSLDKHQRHLLSSTSPTATGRHSERFTTARNKDGSPPRVKRTKKESAVSTTSIELAVGGQSSLSKTTTWTSRDHYYADILLAILVLVTYYPWIDESTTHCSATVSKIFTQIRACQRILPWKVLDVKQWMSILQLILHNTQTVSKNALCFSCPLRNFSVRTLKFLRRPSKDSWRDRARRLNFLTSAVSWGFLIKETWSLYILSATTFLPNGIFLFLSPFGDLKFTRSMVAAIPRRHRTSCPHKIVGMHLLKWQARR